MFEFVVGKALREQSPFLPSALYEISYLSHMNYYAMNDPHNHGGIELILCISGITILEMGHHRYRLVPGMLVAIPSDVPHRILVQAPPYRRWLMHVHPAYVPAILRHQTFQQPMVSNVCATNLMWLLSRFDLLFSSLTDRITSPDRDDPKPLGMFGLHFLELGWHRMRPIDDENEQADIVQSIIAPALQLIHRTALQVNMTQLAHHVHFSESHVRRVFRQFTSLSITDYIRIQRLEKAQRLLLRSVAGLPINTIANLLNFQDTAHFSHYFKRNVGLSPSEYRQQYHLPYHGPQKPINM